MNILIHLKLNILYDILWQYTFNNYSIHLYFVICTILFFFLFLIIHWYHIILVNLNLMNINWS